MTSKGYTLNLQSSSISAPVLSSENFRPVNLLTENAFAVAPFVRCWPAGNCAPGERLWSQTRGSLRVQIEADSGCELPRGQDRVILILLATMAWHQRRRRLELGSAYQILRLLGQSVTGSDYQRLAERFSRLLSSHVWIWSTPKNASAAVVRSYRFHESAELWYNRPDSAGQAKRFSNVVTLSPEFCADIRQSPVQINMRILRALVNAPGALDLCLFIAWRSHCVRPGRSARIPLIGSLGLVDQLNSGPYLQERDFRRQIRLWLTRIKALWPDCPAVLSGDERNLLICHGPLSVPPIDSAF